MRLPTAAVAVAALLSQVSAHCPNFCSKKGRCVDVAKCECFENYMGGDCSQRKCPWGIAWADVAIGDDKAHQPAECSNRGVCNHETGMCECMEGYEGLACNRMICPDECSTHGRCRSMRTHATKLDRGLQRKPYFTYTTPWDADLIHGCSCDEGYSGYNCLERVCPVGDDPLTMNQSDEVQIIRCDIDPTDPSSSNDRFTLSFRGETTKPFNPRASAATIRKLLEDLPTVGAVSVAFSSGLTFCNADYPGQASNPGLNHAFIPRSGNIVSVTFLSEHGDVPSLVLYDAKGAMLSGLDDNQIEMGFNGEGIPVSTPTGASMAYSVLGTKENAPCSNRGTCNTETGDCECFPGFYSSDAQGRKGTVGDCGFAELPITTCPGFPEDCSGHGTCSGSATFTCACFDGWTGGDCSIRTCPKAKAWFDYPTSNNEAHAVVECSNKGECDRETGRCICEPLFEGAACERMTCPGSHSPYGVCNGHGQCLPMGQLANFAKNNGDATPFTYGQNPNEPLTWDSNSVYGCLCDEGWTGYDCSLRTCPLGYDVTLKEADATLTNEVQLLGCELLPSRSTSTPTFRLRFREAETKPIRFDAPPADVKAALEALPTIGRVTVGFSLGQTQACPEATGYIMTFSFDTEHGDVPPLQVVMDEASVTDSAVYGRGYGQGDGWTNSDLRFTGGDVNSNYALPANADLQHYPREYYMYTYLKSDTPAGFLITGVRSFELTKGSSTAVECSGRGICNRQTGQCTCFKGFGSSDGNRGVGFVEDCGWREVYTKPEAPESILGRYDAPGDRAGLAGGLRGANGYNDAVNWKNGAMNQNNWNGARAQGKDWRASMKRNHM